MLRLRRASTARWIRRRRISFSCRCTRHVSCTRCGATWTTPGTTDPPSTAAATATCRSAKPEVRPVTDGIGNAEERLLVERLLERHAWAAHILEWCYGFSPSQLHPPLSLLPDWRACLMLPMATLQMLPRRLVENSSLLQYCLECQGVAEVLAII